MAKDREQTVSLWMATKKVQSFSPLEADARTDVCVVGAGIAGLTTAYLLAREGRSVIVLNDGPILCGQTQRTTAHLSNVLDDRFFEIEKIHGEEGSQLAAQSHGSAIDKIESIVQEEGIDCDFERLDGYLFAVPGRSDEGLKQELEAAHRAGLHDVTLVQRAPISSFHTGPALRFPRQAQFHPLKYLTELADAIRRMGGQIYTGTYVKSIEGDGTVEVRTGDDGPVVRANSVVVATNTPMNDRFAIHTKQAPYQTYAIGVPVPSDSVTRALYWDDWYTSDAYHYIRLQKDSADRDILIVGGEDHKTGQADDQDARWARLEAWTRERFPVMGPAEYRWSGMVMETTDGLAFIGRNPGDQENIYIATGDSGMGMTHGTIAGMLLTDLIQGRENPWSNIYDPSRKPMWGMAWREFLYENANVAKEYVKDRLSSGEVSSVDEIAPGEGALMRRGVNKIAVYRDEHGEVHERSAVCPHLGCIVHWNGGEKTWDCPCHGSRFDAKGEVISAPATAPLAEVSEDSKSKPRELAKK